MPVNVSIKKRRKAAAKAAVPPGVPSPDETEYVVAKIVGRRLLHPAAAETVSGPVAPYVQYKVHWASYPSTDDQWCYEAQLTNCREKISDYLDTVELALACLA